MEWVNFLVRHKLARGTDGIIDADKLVEFSANKTEEHYYCVFNLRKDLLKIEFDTGKKKPIIMNPQTGKEEGGGPVYDLYPQTSKMKGALTTKQYEGPAYPALGLVQFDFDSSDESLSFVENVKVSLKDATAFMKWTEVPCQIAFTGSKGFHVAVPFEAFGLEADEHLCKNLHDVAAYLKTFYKTLDTSVYNANRKFRVLNTKHPKTDLFKTLIHEDMSVEEILALAKTRQHDSWYVTYDGVEVSKAIDLALTESAKQHNYDKGKAGNSVFMTAFESYENKLCIQNLINNRCESGGRNDTLLRIIGDFKKTNKSRGYAERIVAQWCADNELPLDEGMTIIRNVYDYGQYYNHGCQDPIKKANCVHTCGIWNKVSKEKRNVTVGAPKSLFKEQTKKTKMSAGRYIQEWLQHNVANVDLSGNWKLHDKYIAISDLQDQIFCDALASKLTVDSCPKSTIESHLSVWSRRERENRLEELRRFIVFDGESDELQGWLKALKPDADDVDLAVVKHWVWLVKRKIMGLGVAHHVMPIFSGLTGSGKSVAVRKLISPLKMVAITPPLSILSDEREGFNLVENYIMFFDEMAGSKKADIDIMKNKITLDDVTYRKLGTNSRINGPMNCSFIGACNPRVIDIIKDPTSTRRYYELLITVKADWDVINTIDYLKLWRSIDESREYGYLEEEFFAEIKVRQEVIRHRDPIEDWLESHDYKSGDGVEFREVAARSVYSSFLAYIEFQKLHNKVSISETAFGREMKIRFKHRRVEAGNVYAMPKHFVVMTSDNYKPDFRSAPQPMTASSEKPPAAVNADLNF